MTVYPQWWGSVGDGVAYDRLPVQFAIENASKRDGYGRGVVSFCGCSERIYRLSNVVYMMSNVLFDMNNNTLFQSRGNRQIMIFPQGAHNSEVRHVRWRGTGVYRDIGIGRSACAFNPAGAAPGVSHCQVDSCYFEDNISTCVIGGNGVFNCKFFHNESHTLYGESGWYFSGSSRDTFVDNIVEGPGQNGGPALGGDEVGGARGFYFKADTEIVVRRNVISNWPGYQVCFPDYLSFDVHVDSNVINGSDKYGSEGIMMSAVDRGTITFNRITKCNFYGIDIRASHIQCLNNFIDSTLLYRGIEIYPPWEHDLVGRDMSLDYVTVKGNRTHDCYGGGIRLITPGVNDTICEDTIESANSYVGVGVQVESGSSSTIVHDIVETGYFYRYYINDVNIMDPESISTAQFYNNR
jgi:hypothetical protein